MEPTARQILKTKKKEYEAVTESGLKGWFRSFEIVLYKVLGRQNITGFQAVLFFMS